jgi:hypothetical protein
VHDERLISAAGFGRPGARREYNCTKKQEAESRWNHWMFPN